MFVQTYPSLFPLSFQTPDVKDDNARRLAFSALRWKVYATRRPLLRGDLDG
jgi:hypothetical protein